ncbi:MAG: tetratricopeptide repeat protein [Bacteroidia bacterium]|jgi:Tfp pilus assembly protein PilF
MMTSRILSIQEMLEKEPGDSFLRYALALEYSKEDISKAIELLEELLAKDPNYLGAYYQLGKYYEQNGNTSKAADCYTKGITIAKAQNNRKTLGELNEALLMLDED